MSGTGSERIRFHGRIPHTDVPRFIAAADLCLAPYAPSWFPSGEVGYSTLKVREYLSSGRPVATVPSGVLTTLVHPGENGFLVDNRVEDWRRLLQELPSREILDQLGENAARTRLDDWQMVAAKYLMACREARQRVESGGVSR